ncbi:MAG: hypothetical protein IT431_05590 [Phycisphaerales bacterium]|nr:hypothetical protein [Phycisphaerales bacterium]
MKLRGNLAVLNYDGHQLSAVWGMVHKDSVRIRGWLSAERPSDLDPSDGDGAGAWVGRALKEADCSTRQCIIAVPRASVVLKRLSFPTLAEGADADLAGMVYLQMARQLTMPLHGAALDFVRLQPPAGGAGPAPTTEVLAAALPGEQVTACRTLAKHAKLNLRSVALRGEGSAALFAQLSYTQDGPVLGVSVTPQGVELGIVSEGRVVFSRAVDIPPPVGVEDWRAFADRISVEAKRSRISFRGAGESKDLVCIAMLGDDSLAASVGRTLSEELSLPWEAVRFPNAIEIPSGMDGPTRAMLAPLIGLMLGAAINRPTYDFANPRKAPDTAASLRQAGLAAMLGLVIFGGGGWVLADQQLNSLQAKVKQVQQDHKKYQDQYLRQLRAEARINHIEKLREPAVDWVAHLEYLSRASPPAGAARLESVNGSIKASAVRFGDYTDGVWADAKRLADGKWTKSASVEFTISGSASREVANNFRDSLVASDVYLTSTRGADVAGKFEYILTARAPSPKDVVKDEPAEAPARTGGAS